MKVSLMLDIDSLRKTYSPEEIAIILLTRLYFNTQPLSDVLFFLNNEQIDWHLFYKTAVDNDIQGFLYDVISVSKLKIDTATYNALKKDAAGIALVTSYQKTLLDDLLPNFKNIGVLAIPYKGYTLAARYYRSPLFRKSGDIDFLIQHSDLPILTESLQQLGYKPRFSISKRHDGYIKKYLREIPFVSPRSKTGFNCTVELKWKLSQNYFGHFLSYPSLSKHVIVFDDKKGSIALHPTYDFLSVASHHLIRESLYRFKYLIDLAAIIHTADKELDWAIINQQFKIYNFSSALDSGVNALKEVLGISIPLQQNLKVSYKIFWATGHKKDINVFLKKIKLNAMNLSFLHSVKFGIKAILDLFTPKLSDLAKINYPVWIAVAPLAAYKFFRFIYKRLILRRT